MDIVIRDTKSGRDQPLEPGPDGTVGIYACGPTVYGPIHIGNARPFVVFSLYKRFLAARGYAVTLVINLTDVNDKIYAAAQAQERDSAGLAAEMVARYTADTDRLGLGRPDVEPLATQTVPEIIALIEALIDRGHAYESAGDVYFDVRSDAEAYGSLSHRTLDAMDQGEGNDGLDRKRSPLDFALWKTQKPGEDTSWESPWGPGRPAWHIECSAMGEKYLGLDFQIHGGGSDLVFPHHENEAAQTRAGRGRELAKIWMHNGMLRMSEKAAEPGEKMSKSLGNVVGLADAVDQWGRDAIVLAFVSAHYRQPMDYNADVMRQATASVARIREAARRAGEGAPVEGATERFFAALADDFNTPAALAVLYDWIRAANSGDGGNEAQLREMLSVFALDNLLERESAPAEVVALAEARVAARAAKDYAESDRLRDAIAAAGWVVRDTADGFELTPQA
jgi:cysteinyl-tRNA synthetase